jgi:hypothetical protein
MRSIEELLSEIKEIKESNRTNDQRIAVLEAEVKKLEEPKPWKPKNGERYYYIGRTTGVLYSYWTCSDADVVCYRIGNCFPTEERAKQVSEKIKMLLKLELYHDMFCPDYVPDWRSNMHKHYVFYNKDKKKWDIDWSVNLKRSTEVYFDSEETAQEVCDLLNWEE